LKRKHANALTFQRFNDLKILREEAQ
jgi:hypothetical protein